LNDVYEGGAVILAALAVWAFGAGWPDLLIAVALLLLFLRSAWRELRAAGLGRATPSPVDNLHGVPRYGIMRGSLCPEDRAGGREHVIRHPRRENP
jgi:hypothetical protein